MKFLLVILTLSGFAEAQTSTQVREYQSIQRLVETVKELSADDLSCDRHSDCKALPIGSKICGGPEGWVVASVRNNNFSEIAYLALRTRLRQESYNSRYPDVGDCEYIPRPDFNCENRKCVDVVRSQEE